LSKQIPWFRVVVEGVVIVASILLAFGIQAWWEGSQERELERRYLEALRGEFAAVQANVPGEDDTRAGVLHAHEALIIQTQSEEMAPADSLFLWMSQTSYPHGFDPPRAVFDDLLSSGGTRLIRSDPLRVELARYGAQLDFTRRLDDQAWATWEQRMQPFLEGRVPRVDRIRRGLYSVLGYEPPFGPSRHAADFEGVLTDPAFEDMLADRWLRLDRALAIFRELSLLIDRIVALIDSSLEAAG